MANQNTTEYLDKIKTRLFENLRMLPHAPGVQMQGWCLRMHAHCIHLQTWTFPHTISSVVIIGRWSKCVCVVGADVPEDALKEDSEDEEKHTPDRRISSQCCAYALPFRTFEAVDDVVSLCESDVVVCLVYTDIVQSCFTDIKQ